MSFRNLAVCALAAAIAAPAFGATPLIDAPPPLNPPVKLTLGAVKVPHVAPFNSIADAARPLGVEVEIFSARNWWQRDPDEVLQTVRERLMTVC